MPTNKKPPAARGKRRGKHREKRLKMLDVKPHWLANDAPYGEYRVDFVAMELFLRCAGLSHYGEDEFVRLLREDVSIAAALATRVHKGSPSLAAGMVASDESLLRRFTSYSVPH